MTVLSFSAALWGNLVSELHAKTEGLHESGAFVLGRRRDRERTAVDLVFYDDLDPHAYASGICVLHGEAFADLWERCARRDLTVVADVHVHPFGAGQSWSDRKNPMIARPGHIAIILPRMARPPVRRWSIGVYEYLGNHEWSAKGGCRNATLRIGD